MRSEHKRTNLLEQSVEYEVRESADATQPRIDVGIHALTVVLPEGSDDDPAALLQENAEWVLEKKAKFHQYKERAPDRTFEEGEEFPYLGDEYELVIEQRSASDIEDGAVRLAKHHVEQTSVQQALERLYRRKARERIEQYLDRYVEEMGVEYDKLEVRNQRTKWGSCSSSGTLGINWRLVMAPPEILKYVVIHELAHLEEANHTDAFWSLVAEHDPAYQDHVDWLDENGVQLIFTEDDL